MVVDEDGSPPSPSAAGVPFEIARDSPSGGAKRNLAIALWRGKLNMILVEMVQQERT